LIILNFLEFSLRLKPLIDTGLETGANGKPPSPTLPPKGEGSITSYVYRSSMGLKT